MTPGIRTTRGADLVRAGVPAFLLASFGYVAAVIAGWTTIGLTTAGWETDPGIPNFILEGIVIGVVISPFQWFALRFTGVGLLRLTLAGSAGLAIGWPIGELLSEPVGWMVSLMIFGLAIGIAQWFVLRTLLARGYVWVAISILAWTLSALPVVSETLGFFLSFLLGAALFGAVLAIAVVMLMAKGYAVKKSALQ